MFKRLAQRLVGALVATAVSLGIAGVFQVQDAHAIDKNSYTQTALSETEIQQLAEGLEFFFDTYFQKAPNGSLSVNEERIIANGLEKDLLAFYALARGIEDPDSIPVNFSHGSSISSHANPITTQGFTDFAKCLAMGALGIPIGNAPGLYAAFREGLRAWNWGLTARTVARILGPTVVKALGGPAGIALALGWAAVTCRDKL